MKLAALLLLVGAALVSASDQDFSIADFTKSPTEHIINQVDEPFVVQSIRGLITSDSVRGPLQGVLFEVQGPDSERTIRASVSDKNGRFNIKHVPYGSYHFKATMNGWQSVIGTIIVSKKADKSSMIKVDMHVGV